jgi:hypothetical protein
MTLALTNGCDTVPYLLDSEPKEAARPPTPLARPSRRTEHPHPAPPGGPYRSAT